MLYNFRGEATQSHQEYLVKVALEFAALLDSRDLLIAHDSRPASARVACALFNALPQSLGKSFLGMCSTPAVAYASRRGHCPAIVVTASHNPWTQTGLKLFAENGLPISPSFENKLRQRCDVSAHAELPVFSTQQPEVSRPNILLSYFELLREKFTKVKSPNVLLEAGVGWISQLLEWLPGINTEGAARTDPTVVQPSQFACQYEKLIRVDEDMDKLVWWENGREIPGQFVLGNWIALRPRGTVCLSFDTTAFVQRHLERLGYRVTRCPVGDQFVAKLMKALKANTGGEPNGHFIAAERSFSPDALACALDLLESDPSDHSWWMSTEESHYCRGVISPFQLSLGEAFKELGCLPQLRGYQVSSSTETKSIFATDAVHRVIFRISQFERVAVVQAEGVCARSLFDAIVSHLAVGPIERKDEWTG